MRLIRHVTAARRRLVARLQPWLTLFAVVGFVWSAVKLAVHLDWWIAELPMFAAAFVSYFLLFAVLGHRLRSNLPAEGEEWLQLFSGLWGQRFVATSLTVGVMTAWMYASQSSR